LKPASILQNIGWLGLANIVSKPIWLVFIVLTTRLLGSEQFGIFIFLLTLGSIICAFTELGLDLQVVRSISPNKGEAARISGISIALRLFGVVIFTLISLVLFQFVFKTDYSIEIFLAGIFHTSILFVTNHIRAIFRSLELLKYEAISYTTEKFLLTFFGITSLFLSGDLLFFLIAYNGGALLTLIITGVFLRKLTGFTSPKIPTKTEVVSLLKPALPFAYLNIIQMIYTRLGILLLERLSGNLTWVGFYSAGSRFSDAFVVFPNTIMAAVYPVFCRIHEDVKSMWNLVGTTSRALLAIAVPVGFTIFTAHFEFTHIVFGDEYIEASMAIGVFGITLIAMSQVYIFGSIVSATGNQHKTNAFMSVLIFFSLAAYLIFIPKFGYIAAAIITCIDQFILFAINYFVARKYVNHKEYAFNLFRVSIFPITGLFMFPLFAEFTSGITLIFIVLMWNTIGTVATGLIRIADIKNLLNFRSS
jgi:O-antigen/teichoic acid export membrane protein